MQILLLCATIHRELEKEKATSVHNLKQTRKHNCTLWHTLNKQMPHCNAPSLCSPGSIEYLNKLRPEGEITKENRGRERARKKERERQRERGSWSDM